jgi:hypothetical protein
MPERRMGTRIEDTRRQHKRKDPTHARVFADAIVVATEARAWRERGRTQAYASERRRG